MKKLKELTPSDHEVAWSKALAAELHGRAEERTLYGSRCDIVTRTHAIEVEWSKKPFEAAGQALFYSVALARKPAVILLVNDEKAEKENVGRCAIVCAKADITFTWINVNKPLDNLDEIIEVLDPDCAALRRSICLYEGLNQKEQNEKNPTGFCQHGFYLSTH